MTIMTTVTQLQEFLSADYSAVFGNDTPVDRFFSMFTSPWVPIASVLLYLVASDIVFETIRKTFNVQPKGSVLQLITIVHSLALAVYSGWTFVNAFRIVSSVVSERGLYGTLCDPNLDLWSTHNFGFWVTHFYISKYYEFIDTWIILLKGRKPMFLQTYHHAGIVLISWGFVVTKNSGAGVILVTFNSFIHTLMYTYYVFAALGFNSSLKKFLTQAQMIQFLVGGALLTPMYWMDTCINPAQALTNASIHAYLVGLVYLFYQFYVSSYTARKKQQ